MPEHLGRIPSPQDSLLIVAKQRIKPLIDGSAWLLVHLDPASTSLSLENSNSCLTWFYFWLTVGINGEVSGQRYLSQPSPFLNESLKFLR